MVNLTFSMVIEYYLKWPVSLNLKEMYRDRREEMSPPDVWGDLLVTSSKTPKAIFLIGWLSSINPKTFCLCDKLLYDLDISQYLNQLDVTDTLLNLIIDGHPFSKKENNMPSYKISGFMDSFKDMCELEVNNPCFGELWRYEIIRGRWRFVVMT